MAKGPTKGRTVLVIVFLASVCLLAWLVWPSAEPVYQGRPLGAWLKAMEKWDGDTNDTVFVAFRGMGTNAIPPLLQALQSRPPPFHRMISELNRKQYDFELPFVFELHHGWPWHRNFAASCALYAMGTNADPALPTLTNLLMHDKYALPSAIALAGIGSHAVPSLLAALTNQNIDIRQAAAAGLGYQRTDLERVVPGLVACLGDTSDSVRGSAVLALGQIHAEPALTVPALIKQLSSTNLLNRTVALMSLGKFGPEAHAAVPYVVHALSDGEVSLEAAKTLKQIDPEAAAKAHIE